MLSNSSYVDLLQRWECRDSSYLKADPPLVFKRAKGSTIWDVEGRAYVDLCAGFGVMSLGHNSQVQADVFQQSLSEEALIVHGMGDVYPSADKAELLALVGSLLPSYLAKGALALSGGQAVEIAVKTAQLKTGKQGFLCFEGSYHGLDLGILPLTSRHDFKDPFRKWIPDSLATELAFGCSLELIEEAICRRIAEPSGCAAIIVEPIQGRAGFRFPPPGWLEGISELCRKYQILLILDEIFIGLGRVGFISSAANVAADLVCFGKALGGGLPLSACFGRKEVMDAWPLNSGEAIHTGTFFGHPLSCRLGKATLDYIIRNNLMSRAMDFGEKLRADLEELWAISPLIKEIRGTGLLTCIELREAGLGARWMDLLRSHGVIALANGMQGQGIAITPALTISEEEWAKAFEALKGTLPLL